MEAGGEQEREEMEEIIAAKLEQYLSGTDYPADKHELIRVATSNNAPDNVMTYMNRLPERTYDEYDDVEEEFSKLG